MKRNNSKEKVNRKFWMFQMLASLFKANNVDEMAASRRAYHQTFMEGGNPEFHPVKHTVMNYATQNRLAKKRRKSKKK